jgi:hypothetical protein
MLGSYPPCLGLGMCGEAHMNNMEEIQYENTDRQANGRTNISVVM